MSTALALVVLVATAAAVVAWFAPAFWVCRDARRRRLSSTLQWTAVVLFTSYIGLVAYVISTGSPSSAVVSTAD